MPKSKKTTGLSGNGIWIALIVLILIHITLVFSLRLLPFVDLPNHLAAATIHKYYDQSANGFADFYEVDPVLRPNTFHFYFCSLPVFPSVEFANKLFYALYIMLFPLSVLFLIRKINGNQWLSLLSIPLLYSFSVGWGFVGFTLAIPVILFMVGFMIDYLNYSRLKDAIILSALFVVLFFIHGIAALFAILVYIIFSIATYKKSWLHFLRSILVILPFIVLYIFWYAVKSDGYGARQITTYLSDYYSSQYIARFLDRLEAPLLHNIRLFDGFSGQLISLLFLAAILIPLVLEIYKRGRSYFAEINKSPARLIMVFGIICLLCCLLLPRDVLLDPSLLYQRFAIFLVVSVLVLGSLHLFGRYNKHFITGILLLCLVHFALWTHYFTGFQNENKGFKANVLPPGSAEKRLAYLPLEIEYRGHPVYIHFQNYYIVWKRGIATTALTQYVFGAVKRKTDFAALPPHSPWISIAGDYLGQYQNMDYILFRGDMNIELARHLVQVEEFQLNNFDGTWGLFAKPER